MVGSSTGPVIESEVVTGERLQALAEATVLPRLLAFGDRNPRQIPQNAVVIGSHREIEGKHLDRLSRSKSIFVYTDAIGLFQDQIWPRLTRDGYVLITHNSDQQVGPEQIPWIERAGNQLVHWFAQNLTVNHPKLSPLPIGIANREWPHGDIEVLCEVARETWEVRPSELIHAAFDLNSHPHRQTAWTAIHSALPGTPERPPPHAYSYRDYLRDLARHRFCACPRGNGIDTHRLWESLYLGVVPVVERSTHTERWAREGIPVVLLDDWCQLSRERLESDPFAEIRFDPPKWLYLSHYARSISTLTAPLATAS